MVTQHPQLAYSQYPHSTVRVSPATPVLQLPQAVADCWRQLTAALLVLVKLWCACAMGDHHSGAGCTHCLAQFSCSDNPAGLSVIIVTARLHACSPVGTAMPSFMGHHIMLQLQTAEHEVAGLVAVVASA